EVGAGEIRIGEVAPLEALAGEITARAAAGLASDEVLALIGTRARLRQQRGEQDQARERSHGARMGDRADARKRASGPARTARRSLLDGRAVKQAQGKRTAGQAYAVRTLTPMSSDLRAAPGQEAADGDHAIVDVVPDNGIADAVGLLDDSTI